MTGAVLATFCALTMLTLLAAAGLGDCYRAGGPTWTYWWVVLGLTAPFVAGLLLWHHKRGRAASPGPETAGPDIHHRWYEEAARLASDAFLLLDPEGRILEFNPMAVEYYGYSPVEFSGLTYQCLGGPDVLAGFEFLKHQVDHRRGKAAFSTVHRRADGTPFPVEIGASFFEAGGRALYLAVVRNAKDWKGQEMLSAAIRNHDASIVITDHLGSIEFVNPRFTETTGFTADEVIGKSLWDEVCGLIPEPDSTEHPYTPGREWCGDTRARTKDGRAIPEHVRIAPIRDSGDAVINLVVVKEDITAERAAEERLRLLESIVLNAADEIVVTDVSSDDPFECRIVFANPSFLRQTGYTLAEICGKPQSILLGPATDPRLAEQVRESMAKRKEARFEFPGRRKDGSYYWAEVNWMPLCDDQGRATQFVTMAHDVSERRRMEEELRRREELFRRVTDTVPAVIWMADAQSRTTFLSRQWEHFTGRTVEQGLNGMWAEVVHPDDYGIVAGLWESLGRQESVAVEFRVLAADGQYHWVYDQGSPQFDEQGRFTGHIGTCVDITGRKRTEEALRAAQERFRVAAENASDLIFESDLLTGKRQYFGCLSEKLGLTVEELPPATEAWKAMLHPEDRERVLEAVRRHLETGERFAIEYRLMKDGEVVHVAERGTATRDGAGRPVRWTGVVTNINERKRAEVALRASEERFRLAFEEAPIGIFLVKTDYRIESANQAFCELVGYTEQELREASYLDLTCPEHAARYADLTSRLVRGEVAGYRVEKPIRTRAGETVWVNLSATVIRDAEDQILYCLVMAENITGRRQAELALRNSESLLRRVADTVPAMIWMSDPSGRYTFHNRKWYEITGWRTEDGLGFGWMDVVYPKDRRAVEVSIKATGRRQTFSVEYRIQRADGELRWLLNLGTPHYYEDGTFAGYVGSCIDITERKRTEEQISKLSRALEHSPVMVLITDAAGSIEYANPKFTEVTGYSLEEVKGRNPRILKSGKTPPELYGQMWTRLATGEWRGEIQNRKKNGELFWETSSISPIRNAENVITHYVAVKEDITERKQLDELLQASEERFRVAAKNASDLIFEVDLRTGRCEFFGPSARGTLAWKDIPPGVDGWLELVHPEDRERVWVAFWRSIVSEERFRREFRMTTRDRILHVAARGSLVRETDGKPRKWIGVASDITETKRTEAALRESEARFRHVFEDAAVGIILAEVDTLRILRANRYFCEMLGYTEQELKSLTVAQLSNSDDMARELAQGRALLRDEIPSFRIDKRYYRIDGDVIWADVNVTVIRDGEGRNLYALGVVENISERRRAEQALRASEERLKLVMEATNDGVWDWNCLTDELYLSPQCAAMLGYSGDELVWHRSLWKSLVHPDDHAAVRGVVRAHMRGEAASYECEYRMRTETGAWIWVLDRGKVVEREETGRPLRATGVCTDITRRRQAEDAAQEATSRLAAIVHFSDDAIVGKSLDGTVISWNSGAEKLYGYTAEEICGRSAAVLIPPEARTGWSELIYKVRSGVSVKGYETVRMNKAGTRVAVSITLSPVMDSSGVPIGISCIVHDITKRKEAENQLTHQANHDQLTALPNRRLFEDRLQQAIAYAERGGHMVALLFVDLDGFKLINDTLGHSTGDTLLKLVSERLKSCMRHSDTLARTGGDEFSIVATSIESVAAAVAVANKLLSIFQKPFEIETNELFISASVGISLYPQDGRDPGTLQKNADAAMYGAKRGGKSRFQFFTPELSESAQERLDLENHLRRALRRGELMVHYQPLFHLQTNTLTGAEALMRWRHPKKGWIPPAKFIPIAEETGLIVWLGNWVLREACKQQVAWLRAGRGPGKVAVNVSGVQFARPDFVEVVARALAEPGLDAHRLELELTESVVMWSFEESAKKILELRNLGVGIAIDDFGTGYSSLSYLQRLPINALKIDKSFLRDIGVKPSAIALVEGIVSLAHSLGMLVVAEGVETQEQLDALRNMGCDEAQGFLLGMPALDLLGEAGPQNEVDPW